MRTFEHFMLKENTDFSSALRRSWARQGVPPSSGPSGHLPRGEGFGRCSSLRKTPLRISLEGRPVIFDLAIAENCFLVLWARDLLSNKDSEIPEYFVYCGVFEAHNWKQRSGHSPKGQFLEMPLSTCHPVRQRLRLLRQRRDRACQPPGTRWSGRRLRWMQRSPGRNG